VQHNRETGQTLFHFLQNVEAQLRLGAGLELVGAVAGADGNGQRVAAGLADKFLHVLGTGVGGILRLDIDGILNAGQCAQLGLNDDAVIVGILHDLAGQRDIVLKGTWKIRRS
jgi:hypothetical protein